MNVIGKARASARARPPGKAEQARSRQRWVWLAARALGAVSLLAVGAIHLQQYFELYSAVPTIGTLFVLNFVGATILGLGLLTPVERLLGRLGAPVLALLAVWVHGAGLRPGGDSGRTRRGGRHRCVARRLRGGPLCGKAAHRALVGGRWEDCRRKPLAATRPEDLDRMSFENQQGGREECNDVRDC